MSVVVAVVQGGVAYMGGDALLTSGDHVFRGAPKVQRWGPVLLGLVGDCEWIEALRYVLPPAGALAGLDGELVVHHVQAVSAAMRELRKRAKDEVFDLEALIAWPGGMMAYETTSAIPIADACFAIGSGGHFALGAMHAAARRRPAARVAAALQAAADLCPSVGGPMTVLDLHES